MISIAVLKSCLQYNNIIYKKAYYIRGLKMQKKVHDFYYPSEKNILGHLRII